MESGVPWEVLWNAWNERQPEPRGDSKTSGATSRTSHGLSRLAPRSCLLSKVLKSHCQHARPVIVTALFFNGSLMFVAGIQIVASRPITLRSPLSSVSPF